MEQSVILLPSPGGDGCGSFCRRQSTKTAYSGRWNKFVGWCSGKNIDPLRSHILQFTLSLAQQGSSVSTVKGYLAALSAFVCLPDQPSLFKSPIVMRFLKGLNNRFPPTPFDMPHWDLNLVLTFLMGVPSEPCIAVPLGISRSRLCF